PPGLAQEVVQLEAELSCCEAERIHDAVRLVRRGRGLGDDGRAVRRAHRDVGEGPADVDADRVRAQPWPQPPPPPDKTCRREPGGIAMPTSFVRNTRGSAPGASRR